MIYQTIPIWSVLKNKIEVSYIKTCTKLRSKSQPKFTIKVFGYKEAKRKFELAQQIIKNPYSET